MSSNSKLEKEQKHLAQKSNKFIPKQKNSVIENMLEKKLSIAKKKQPILWGTLYMINLPSFHEHFQNRFINYY